MTIQGKAVLSASGFSQTLDDATIPAGDRARIRDAFIDCIGCALSAADGPIAAKLRIVVPGDTAPAPGRRSRLFGTVRYAAPQDAALYNATIAHALDYDDYSHPAYSHPSVALVPALLALAEEHGQTGREVITAYALGLQVFGQLGRALNLDHCHIGWHPTGTFGTVAAAAASAKLLGLEGEAFERALSIAGSSASGLRINFGTETKPYHAGMACRDGLMAALLAKTGMTAKTEIWTGKYGFAETFNSGSQPKVEFLTNWTRELEISSEYGLALKPYPSCVGTHTAIDSALELRARIGGRIERIRKIRIGQSDLAALGLFYCRPATPLEGKFSNEFCVAAAFLNGRVDLKTFDERWVASPEIAALIDITEVEIDERVRTHSEMGTVVAVELDDGTVEEAQVMIALGKPERWFSREQLAAKFLDCTSDLGAGRGRAVFEALWGLDSDRPVREVLDRVALTLADDREAVSA